MKSAAFVYVLMLTNPRDAGKVWGVFDTLSMARAAMFFCPNAHPIPMLELPPYVEEPPEEPVDVNPAPMTVETVYDTPRYDGLGFGPEPTDRGCTVVKWYLNSNRVEVAPER